MLISQKVVCQQSFFTLAPYASGLFDFLRSFVHLPFGPGLKRNLAGLTHFLNNPHFSRIGTLQIPCLIFDRQQQRLHSTSQIRMRTQSSYKLRITQ